MYALSLLAVSLLAVSLAESLLAVSLCRGRRKARRALRREPDGGGGGGPQTCQQRGPVRTEVKPVPQPVRTSNPNAHIAPLWSNCVPPAGQYSLHWSIGRSSLPPCTLSVPPPSPPPAGSPRWTADASRQPPPPAAPAAPPAATRTRVTPRPCAAAAAADARGRRQRGTPGRTGPAPGRAWRIDDGGCAAPLSPGRAPARRRR
jgi:hypothetical protein